MLRRSLMIKLYSMKEHMGNVSKDKKTLRNSQQEMSANQKHRNK